MPLEIFGSLVDSPAWPALRAVLQLGLLAAAVLVARGLLGLMATSAKPARQRPQGTPGGLTGGTLRDLWTGLFGSLPALALALVFAAVLIHQGSWQLTGIFRPELVAFMQSHDRRQFNPAHGIHRGRILDRAGEPLAYTEYPDGRPVRIYPQGPAFAHAVGYSHPRFGATGAEAAGNARLNGAELEQLASWGELGRALVTRDKRPRGQDLTLTLDAELQRTALRGLGDRRGAAVLLRAADGAVLVLASAPAFDPNRLGPELFRGGDPATPLLNRATQGLYPPGSTFKTVIAAQAMDSGFSGLLDCPANGYTTSARYPKIRDHDFYDARNRGRSWSGHGRIGLPDALIESSNVFFAQLGVHLGREALFAAGERFGFDRQVRLHPAGGRSWTMSTGRIPRLASRDLYGLAQASIGQGRVLATPAHMATVAAAIANGGLAMRPRLIADDPPVPLGQYMQPETAARLVALLTRAVAEGTGRSIHSETLAIAGKTGTAENPRGAPHSWFIGLAPAESPALAVAVLVEHGGYGSRAAAPIARDLLMQGLGVPPDPPESAPMPKPTPKPAAKSKSKPKGTGGQAARDRSAPKAATP